MANLKLIDVNKIYDNSVQAVFNFNLQIEDKEFVVFVGPSGCGKSTTLRMIAGLEEINSGEIYIDEVLINEVEPKDRDISMVFQNYALYPHMTVYDNMSFGLRIRKIPKGEIDNRVRAAAKILEIEDLLNRKPKALSGGQRQRVALGRAIVRNSKVFLMDEPLSNLDAKLRVQMRSELVKLHNRIGATTIYVTHDQTEAMTMADKIVVMKDGYIQQVGTPWEIYNDPINAFVAGFIGSPASNFLSGVIKSGLFVVNGYSFELTQKQRDALTKREGQRVIMGIRPEDFIVADHPDFSKIQKLNLEVDVSELLGYEFLIYGKLAGQELIAKVGASKDIESLKEIVLGFDIGRAYFFDGKTEERIV